MLTIPSPMREGRDEDDFCPLAPKGREQVGWDKQSVPTSLAF